MTRKNLDFADITRAVAQQLKTLGFKKKGACWNRSAGVIEVLDLQRSKSLDMVTLNFGVLDCEVFTNVWGKAPRSFVLVAECTLSARIGQLIDGYDKWFPLDSPTVLTDIQGMIESKILPFLVGMRTRESMEEWLDSEGGYMRGYPPSIMSLALIKSSLGHKAEASALLKQLNSAKVSAWKLRIDEVSRNID